MLREPPGSDAGDFEWLIFEQAGVLTTGQAISLLGRPTVDRHVRHGRWRVLCRGLLLTHNSHLDPDQQLWVAVLAAGQGAHLAGTTAITAATQDDRFPPHVHLLIPAKRTPSTLLGQLPPDMAPIRVHRTTVFPPEHQQVGRPPRTTLPRSVIDAAAWARGDNEARTLIMTACQQRRVTVGALAETLTALPRVHRHRLIADTINDLAGGATALSETDLVALCRRFGLPPPQLQVRRADADGLMRYIDAYWPEFHLQVEIDGAHHMEVGHWTADMLRQNQIWIRGDRILRFPAWLVRDQPAVVAAQLRAAFNAYRESPLPQIL